MLEGIMASQVVNTSAESRRNRVMIGPLPDCFLRVDEVDPVHENGQSVGNSQEDEDRALAMALQQQLWGGTSRSNLAGQLNITVSKASLVKNYGFTRMDPYVRVRVGHTVYETHTDPNGSKSPCWNKTFHCYLPVGVDAIYVEIYDECSITPDELIAWGHISIPPNVFRGETIEDWYALSGKQGEAQEGSINVVFSFARVGTQPMVTQVPVQGIVPHYHQGAVPMQQVVVVPNNYGFAPQQVILPANGAMAGPTAPGVATLARPATRPAIPLTPRALTDDEMSEMKDMFPEVDSDVIRSVYEACGGDKAATVDNLLQMSGQS